MSTTPEAIAHELDRLWEQLDPVDDWRPVLDKAAAELRRFAAMETQLAKFIVTHGNPDSILAERDQLRAEVEALRRGEFICQKCGLRKDADTGPVPF